MNKEKQIKKAIEEWFLSEKRDLPWRSLCKKKAPNPYHVWVSEIMLQQTRVDTVIPYFHRFIERFDSIKSLAMASQDEVIKAWEGLGYYSRARKLHQAAQELIANEKENLPQNLEQLLKIPGIGPYTAAAISNFAFHKKAAAVDGNVLRVLSRLFCREEDISKAKNKKIFEELCLFLLDDKEPHVAMEGLIELGALICKPKPKCQNCPLEKLCLAKQNSQVDKLPIQSKKVKIEEIDRYVALVIDQSSQEILAFKNAKGKVMADLVEFPYFEKKEDVKKILKEQFKIDSQLIKELKTVAHSFTRYKVKLRPFLFCAKKVSVRAPYFWQKIENLKDLSFSSGHKRIYLSNFKDLCFR